MVSFAILFNICTYTVYAKYISETIEDISLKIEKPIIEVEAEEQKELTITSNKATYNFKIKNYDNEEKVNKINMEYYIEIVSDRLDILKINLYKGEEKLNLNNYKTDTLELSNKKKILAEYHLEVYLIDEINENIESSVNIKINFNQKQ